MTEWRVGEHLGMSSATLFFAIVLLAVLVVAFGAGAFLRRRERRAQRLLGSDHDPTEKRSRDRRRTEPKLDEHGTGSP